MASGFALDETNLIGNWCPHFLKSNWLGGAAPRSYHHSSCPKQRVVVRAKGDLHGCVDLLLGSDVRPAYFRVAP